MDQQLPPNGLVPADATQHPDRPVHHYANAHPNDLVDPWWMNEALSRGHSEFLYGMWPVDLDDVSPEVVDTHIPEGLALVRRGSLLNARQVQCVFEAEGALACIQIRRQMVWVGVSAPDLASGRALMTAVEQAFPKTEHEPTMDEAPSVGVGVWGMHDDTRAHRRLDVPTWDDIAGNYAPATGEALSALMDPGFTPDDKGKLLVWYGPPGTGKSYALGALAYAWREWATMQYIADPEALLADTGYLMEFLFSRAADDDRWRLAVLEDTGELFGSGARREVGQGLARLLNVTDGMLGKGSRTLFIITTNEPIRTFHEAVVRPGRCLARIEFAPLPLAQAREWLLARGASEVAGRLRRPATVAELYAMVAGELEPAPAEAVGGMYL